LNTTPPPHPSPVCSPLARQCRLRPLALGHCRHERRTPPPSSSVHHTSPPFLPPCSAEPSDPPPFSPHRPPLKRPPLTPRGEHLFDPSTAYGRQPSREPSTVLERRAAPPAIHPHRRPCRSGEPPSLTPCPAAPPSVPGAHAPPPEAPRQPAWRREHRHRKRTNCGDRFRCTRTPRPGAGRPGRIGH
jgi:hypothetical protein